MLPAFGCAGARLGPVAPELAARLHVLHVADEHGKATGYPIGPHYVVASGHQFAGKTPIAAVEGVPMMVGNLEDRRLLNRGQLAPPDDWVILFGSTKGRFGHNVIDPDITLHRGDRVLLGGFFLDGMDYSRSDFLRLPPTVIEGRVLGEGETGTNRGGLVLVEVPDKRYGGFSGGPAAKVDASGEIRVWGTIVYQGYARKGLGLCYVIGVARLPRDVVQSTIIVASYESFPSAVPPRRATTQPTVLHVASGNHLLAGFPVPPGRVVTALRPLIPLELAVVDGVPMHYSNSTAGMDPLRTTGPNWLALFAMGAFFKPDPVETRPSPRPGDSVLLGGFFLPNKDLAPIEFLDVRPSIIRGAWLGRWAVSDAAEPLDWIAVPPADYRAFLGGPATSFNETDGLRVWGVIVDYRGRYVPRCPIAAMIGVSRLSDQPAAATESSGNGPRNVSR